MRLKRLPVGGRLAVSLFALTVLYALLASMLLIVHSTGSTAVVDLEAVKNKYARNMLTGAMWGSMYEHVTEDESIRTVERWVAAGKPRDLYDSEVAAVMKEDCTNCHSRASTMTKAMPGIPLTSYEDVVAAATQGLPDGALLKGLHFHLFGIGTTLVALGLLLAFSGLGGFWKAVLPLAGFAGLWLDTTGWIVGRFSEAAAYMIVSGGALMSSSIAAMAVLVLLDCWIAVPVIGGDDR